MLDNNKISELIIKGRKKKKITQQELAKKLNVSDKAVSNWENGKNNPDIFILREIERVLNIKIFGDKRKENILFTIIALLLIILTFTLFMYWKNYNGVKIYRINLDSQEYTIDKSYLTITNEKLILNMNEILKKEYPKQPSYEVSLYYIDNEEKYLITLEDYTSITLEENKKSSKLLPKEILKHLDNIYLNIKYVNYDNEYINESIKLNLTDLNKCSTNNVDEYKSININLLKNNNYKEINNNIFEHKTDNEKYIYNPIEKTLYYESHEDKIEYYCIFNIESAEINYVVYQNDILKEKYISSENNKYSENEQLYFILYDRMSSEALKLIEF